MSWIVGNADTAFGNVAVFWYPPSARYPKGTNHFGVPTGEQRYGEFYMEEFNFEGPNGCTHTFRWVSFADPHLLGFVTL